MSRQFISCSVEACNGNAHRSANGKMGYCSKHYQRVKKHGDPNIVKSVPSPALDWIAAHVDYAGDDCLIWPFAVGKDGYGRVHRPGSSVMTTASNSMCEQAHGPRPASHECAHSCGNGHRACVNPRHLRWATPTENQADRILHGTTNRGARQWTARLTEDDIREIRSLSGVMPQTEIAALFGVGQDHISRIISRQVWSWL
jgi:hypothetical protein